MSPTCEARNDQGNSESVPQDQPLFVLKYCDSSKEIRLYQDRIEQTSKRTRERAVKLEKAKISVFNDPDMRTGHPFNRIRIWDQGATGVFAQWKGVSWNERSANRQDATRMLDLLAYLSGRRVREFGQPEMFGLAVNGEKLIKKGGNPQDAKGYTFNEELLKEDKNQEQYARIENIGLLIVGVLIMGGMGILLWFTVLRDVSQKSGGGLW
jgi:hypothetical protein